jgi:hypothetical protein
LVRRSITFEIAHGRLRRSRRIMTSPGLAATLSALLD